MDNDTNNSAIALSLIFTLKDKLILYMQLTEEFRWKKKTNVFDFPHSTATNSIFMQQFQRIGHC